MIQHSKCKKKYRIKIYSHPVPQLPNIPPQNWPGQIHFGKHFTSSKQQFSNWILKNSPVYTRISHLYMPPIHFLETHNHTFQSLQPKQKKTQNAMNSNLCFYVLINKYH